MSEGDLIAFSPPFEQKVTNSEDSHKTNQPNDIPITAESLFNDNFIKIDPSSKFSFLNLTDDVFNCNLDLLKNPERESLLFDVSGRESLGVLKLDTLNLSFEVTPNKTKNTPYNNALLHPHSFCNQKLSSASSASFIITPSNFNSESLEYSEPSRIFTHSYLDVSVTNDCLNDGFLNTFSSFQDCNSKIASDPRTRIMSLPNMNEKLIDIEENYKDNTDNIKPKCNSESVAVEKVVVDNEEDEVFNVSVNNDLLNDGFFNTLSSFQDFNSKIASDSRTRIMSLPNMNEKLIDIEENYKDNTDNIKPKCISESVAVEKVVVDNEEDEVFDLDLVLIEAHHVSEKIRDGSILCTSFEENVLDNTAPPEFIEINEDEPVSPTKSKTDVFKNIDKLVPPQDQITEPDPETVQEEITATNPTNQNISNNQSKFSISHNSRTSSKDANEILQNLSVIINNENRDIKQNIEGQQLLLNLADIFYSDGSKGGSTDDVNSLNDSGHSSFEQEQQEYPNCDEALDLRVKSNKSNDENLCPSVLKQGKTSSRRLSQSCQFSTPLAPNKLFNDLKKRIISTKSLDFDKDGSDSMKLKPKKIETKSFEKKKGPLKALIPLGSMLKSSDIGVKRQSLNMKTPSKLEQNSLDLFKNKRTSTPIADPHIKPMAQSTPEGTKPVCDKPISCSSQLKKRKFTCPVSPLARPNSMIANISDNSSGLTHNTSVNSSRDSSIPMQSYMHRRHSATDLKISTPKISKLKRTNSIGKSFRVQSEISRVTETISSAISNVTPMKSFIRRYSINKNILQDKNCVTNSKNVFKKNKERKSEKENIC